MKRHAQTDKMYRSVPMRRSRQQASTAGCFCTIQLEALETRRLFSGATLDADGILTVVGTDFDDRIMIYKAGGDQPKVVVSGQSYSGYSLNFGYGGDFDLSLVRGIRVDGLGGDDGVAVFNDPWNDMSFWSADLMDPAKSLNIPVTLDGGAGDDELISESGADDVLIGGPGYDHSYVRDGHDQFAVEYIENYRDAHFIYGPTGRGWSGGVFWSSTPDQLFADPWQVPNRNGIYFGPNAPHFDDPEKSSASTQVATKAQTPSTDPAPEPQPTSGTAAVTAPSSVFSLAPLAPTHDNPWGDEANLLQ